MGVVDDEPIGQNLAIKNQPTNQPTNQELYGSAALPVFIDFNIQLFQYHTYPRLLQESPVQVSAYLLLSSLYDPNIESKT
jgi:hypothetical protein